MTHLLPSTTIACMYPFLSAIFFLSLVFCLLTLFGLIFHPRFWRNNIKAIQIFLAVWFAPYLVFILFFTGPVDLTQYPNPATSPYKLPWKSGLTRCLSQGNRSFTSHRGLHFYAWDFVMPLGAEIHAARGGKVIKVEQSFSGVGLDDNHIWIEHEDHLISNYGHIQKDGSLVKIGDMVHQGQPIARNGMVGQTTLPHLHFVVFNKDATQSVPISFQDAEGGLPLAGHCYTSQNSFQ